MQKMRGLHLKGKIMRINPCSFLFAGCRTPRTETMPVSEDWVGAGLLWCLCAAAAVVCCTCASGDACAGLLSGTYNKIRCSIL